MENWGSNAGDEVVTQLEGFDGTEPEDIVQHCDLIAQATVAQKTAPIFAYSWKIELVWNPDISHGF